MGMNYVTLIEIGSSEIVSLGVHGKSHMLSGKKYKINVTVACPIISKNVNRSQGYTFPCGIVSISNS